MKKELSWHVIWVLRESVMGRVGPRGRVHVMGRLWISCRSGVEWRRRNGRISGTQKWALCSQAQSNFKECASFLSFFLLFLLAPFNLMGLMPSFYTHRDCVYPNPTFQFFTTIFLFLFLFIYLLIANWKKDICKYRGGLFSTAKIVWNLLLFSFYFFISLSKYFKYLFYHQIHSSAVFPKKM